MYLCASPKTALARIWKPDRPDEEDLTREYMTKLHEDYDRWLLTRDDVAIVDVDSFDNVVPKQIYTRIAEKLAT